MVGSCSSLTDSCYSLLLGMVQTAIIKSSYVKVIREQPCHTSHPFYVFKFFISVRSTLVSFSPPNSLSSMLCEIYPDALLREFCLLSESYMVSLISFVCPVKALPFFKVICSLFWLTCYTGNGKGSNLRLSVLMLDS